jgi:hypothetical protein
VLGPAEVWDDAFWFPMCKEHGADPAAGYDLPAFYRFDFDSSAHD